MHIGLFRKWVRLIGVLLCSWISKLPRCTSLTNCVVFVVLPFSSRIENGAKLNTGLSQITPFITVDGDCLAIH